jgi:hypothetical protein
VPGHPWGPLNPVIILPVRIAGMPWLDVFGSPDASLLAIPAPCSSIRWWTSRTETLSGGTDHRDHQRRGAHPIADEFHELRAYRNRLMERPSFVRVLDEAPPYRRFFPLGPRIATSGVEESQEPRCTAELPQRP